MKLALALALLPAASAFAPSRSGARATTVTNIAVGDSVPADTVLVKEFPFDTIDVPARLAGKKTIVLGLPGAFTPTWTGAQVPGYMSKEDELKAKGIDEILVYCVNDAAVMEAWSDKMNVKPKSLVTMLADPGCKFTEAMGLAMPADEVPPQLGYVRSKRYAAVFNDGTLEQLYVSYAKGDPAGDDDPSASLVENVLPKL